jgi:transcriptional regulator with XRE-family HTH domain
VGFGELIRQRREALGWSQDDLADRMMQIAGRYTLTRQHVWRWEKKGVDPKFWLPTLAKALNLDPDQLRSASANGGGEFDGPPNESVHLYAARELITRAQWNGIITEAREVILLYGMAEYRYAFDAAVPGVLSAATAAGCEVRVLLLDPGLPDIAQIDQAEGNPAGTLSSRIRAALGRFQEIAESCGPRMQVRTHHTAPSVSIVRGDDRMFVTPYVRHLIGRSSPTHELRRAVDGGAFDRYAEHVDNVWTTAKEHGS